MSLVDANLVSVVSMCNVTENDDEMEKEIYVVLDKDEGVVDEEDKGEEEEEGEAEEDEDEENLSRPACPHCVFVGQQPWDWEMFGDQIAEECDEMLENGIHVRKLVTVHISCILVKTWYFEVIQSQTFICLCAR
jgi:tetrahydromethanopterin S-methyltransferase subunit A